jgi:hypothetical protein
MEIWGPLEGIRTRIFLAIVFSGEKETIIPEQGMASAGAGEGKYNRFQ